MIDNHIHLERGSYSEDWLEKFITVGQSRGIKEFGIVEHLYIFKEASHLLYQNQRVMEKQNRSINEYLSFLSDMKSKYNIKIGLEVDYIVQKEEKIRDFVSDLEVDFLIGSVHYLGEWAFDINRDWPLNNYEKIYREYYSTLLKLAKSKIFDILGHPGNIAYFGYAPPEEIENEIVRRFYKELAKEDIVLEINTGGLYRPAKRVFPEEKWFNYIRKQGIEISISSDAHDPEDVGYAINNEAIPALSSAGFTHLISFSKRKKQYEPIKGA